jgi:hypothetical protein
MVKAALLAAALLAYGGLAAPTVLGLTQTPETRAR